MSISIGSGYMIMTKIDSSYEFDYACAALVRHHQRWRPAAVNPLIE